MSWQAQTAVTLYSQQTKFLPLKLLHFLADGADEDGVIDPAPNQVTMAQFLGCTDRTVRSHLNTLIESGELEQTRIGSGPGRPSAYRIASALMEKVEKTPQKAEEKQAKVEENDTKLAARLADLEEKVEEIRIIISTLTTRSEGKVEKVEAKGGKPLVELDADDPSYDPERKEIRNKNLPASPEAAKPFDIYQRLLELEPGMKKGQSLKEIKLLLTGDQSIPAYCPEDIIACGRFLQTDPWRVSNMVTLTTQAIIEKIGKWVAAGRPQTWDDFKATAPPARNGRHPPATDDTMDRLKARLKQQQEAQL